jgi:hypothetical protein
MVVDIDENSPVFQRCKIVLLPVDESPTVITKKVRGGRRGRRDGGEVDKRREEEGGGGI